MYNRLFNKPMIRGVTATIAETVMLVLIIGFLVYSATQDTLARPANTTIEIGSEERKEGKA